MAEKELFGNSEQLNDAVSRKAAIEILAFGEKYFRHLVDDIHVDGYEREKCEWGIYLIETYIAGMKELPSAQPEIIRRKDCKKNPHWEWVGCPMTGENTRKPNDFCSYAERRTDG